MTQGFYEQVGVPVDADIDRIRAAYGRAVSHLMRRREATVSQGGDPSALDLARSQLDEAWAVLSDPARRRRYDAMLAVAGDGIRDTNPDALWKQVAGAMIHPSIAAAARIVDAATRLGVGPLPEPPVPASAQGAASAWDDSTSISGRAPAQAAFGARRKRDDEPHANPTDRSVPRVAAASWSVPSGPDIARGERPASPSAPPDVAAYAPAGAVGAVGAYSAAAAAYAAQDVAGQGLGGLSSPPPADLHGPATIPGPSSYPGFVAAPLPRGSAPAGVGYRPPPGGDAGGDAWFEAASGAPSGLAGAPERAVLPAPADRGLSSRVPMPPGGLADVPRVFVPAPPTPPASPVVVVPPAGLAGPAGPAQGAPTAAAASPAQRLLQIHGPSGALLRAAREAKQLSIQQISDTTRINARLIAALEEEDYAALPSTTQFVRGYVRQVAQLLELDAERVVVGYMRRFSGDV